MAFCPQHGLQLDDRGNCPEPRCMGEAVEQATALDLPKAGLGRRLGGSGLEFTVFLVLEVIGLILSPFTVMVSSMLSSLFAAVYMATKDLGGGRFSVGKRVASVRIVDVKTGLPASNGKALLRNSYYVLGWVMAILPEPFGLLGLCLVFLGVLVDTLMLVASPRGRRLGDLIAGTQVVPVSDR